MNHRALYPVWIESIKSVLLFGSFTWLAMSVLHSEGLNNYWWCLAGFVFVPAFSTVIRRKTSDLRGFLFRSLFLFLYAFMLRTAGLVFVYTIESVLLIIYGCFRIKRAEERPLGYLYLGFSLGISAVLSMAQRDMSKYYVAGSMLYLTLFLFYQHRTSLYDALIDRESSEMVGGKRNVQINLRIFILFLSVLLLFCGLVLLLGIPDYLEGWLRAIGFDLLLIIRTWFRKLFKVRVHLNMIDEDEELLQKQKASHMALEELTQTRFGGIVLRVVLLIGAVVILGAIVYMIIQIIQALKTKKVHTAFGYREEKFFIQPSSVARKIKHNKTEKAPISEIRKRYRRIVEPQIGLSVGKSNTVGEVAEKIPQVEIIRKKYEKERYGQNVM